MTEKPAAEARTKAWLVARSGPSAGSRYLLPGGTAHIGRNPANEIVVQGPQAAVVSLYHAEIFRDGAGYRIRDAGSTNGTFLDGERIGDAALRPQAVVQLGRDGPEFTFLVEETGPSELDRTVAIPKGALLPQARSTPEPEAGGHDALLSDAVMRARRARAEGFGNQTMTLMRDALRRALRRSHRRLRLVIGVLASALVLVSAFGSWKIAQLKREKTLIDKKIQEIEKLLENPETPDQADRLISQLSAYQNQAESLERNLLYRLTASERGAFVTHEIRAVMAEFGAEVYSVPPEFTERVNYHIQQYQGPDRPLMARALNQARGKVDIMRRILEEEKLPPDLAYVPLVESALSPGQASGAGAAGPWQFTPATAREYGLRVDGQVDERHDLQKSTRAGCRYLRKLILDFGAGSSVMLVLAAYNVGPTKVKQAVMKAVQDPIKQRNFWYLYRARLLPSETREYVPKVFAAIILSRNPERFGF